MAFASCGALTHGGGLRGHGRVCDGRSSGAGAAVVAPLRARHVSRRPMARPLRHSTRMTAGGGGEYDVAIVGAGVGGHGAALHAVAKGLKVCIFEAQDIGGTCVNRGCVPSKALLAAAGRIRELKDTHHLSSLGIQAPNVSFDRLAVSNHANGLATRVKQNMTNSLKAIGVDVHPTRATLTSPTTLRGDDGQMYAAKNIILAPGSLPFVPPGITVDNRTVYTSDAGLTLSWLPEWVAIIGSGYIGLEFSDVYTALGANVTFVEAMPNLMPGFDPEITRLAQRLLINPRAIDSYTNVFASKVTPGEPGVRPVIVEMIDAKSKEHVDTLEVDAAMVATGRSPNTRNLGLERLDVELQRGFVPVDETMRVVDKHGQPVDNLFCIGDANGKMMLAHTASTQGVSAVENILGRRNVVNHDAIPAACFTHPEISMVGLTEPQAKQRAEREGFEVSKAISHFRANSKALAENEGDGMCKVLYRKDTGELLGVHIIGLHAADLIQECAYAIAKHVPVQELAFMTHTHPTLSEVVDEAFKAAVGMSAH